MVEKKKTPWFKTFNTLVVILWDWGFSFMAPMFALNILHRHFPVVPALSFWEIMMLVFAVWYLRRVWLGKGVWAYKGSGTE